MKKTYQRPVTHQVLLRVQHHLLAGSGTVTETTMGFGDDAGEGVQGNARKGGSIWDDEE